MATPEEQEHYRKVSRVAKEADNFRIEAITFTVVAFALWMFVIGRVVEDDFMTALNLGLLAAILTAIAIIFAMAAAETVHDLHHLQDQHKNIKNSA